MKITRRFFLPVNT